MNKCEVLLYTSYLHIIGGIETFMINFIDLMSKDYEIGVVCPKIDPEMKARIESRAKLYDGRSNLTCDTLIMIRIMEPIPNNISYKKSIRMCHACRSDKSWYIRQDCDEIVHVSQASKRTFESKGEVILNPLEVTKKESLLIVSATRIPATDKGQNANRMLTLAKMLNDNNISFLWLNFSDAPLKGAPKGFVNVGTYQDLQPFIAKADYLVQLSDQEGFGYSVLEALINGTAVICTPFETTKELGVIDGENGYVIPFDLNFDVRKLLNVPQFNYIWDNKSIRNKWKKIIERKIKVAPGYVRVRVVKPYKDMQLNENIKEGWIMTVTEERAKQLEEPYELIERL